MEDNHFFEGTEKLLEVWFTRVEGSEDEKIWSANTDNEEARKCDLRVIPRRKWDTLLESVKCKIISFSKNDFIDSYVLSESSMFVSQRRFILKTCGSTTTINCIEHLLKLVAKYTGFNEVEDIFYSHKNFMRPELQVDPYCSFEDEVAFLENIFSDGAAYCLGQMNRDCWYLYTRNPMNGRTYKGNEEPDQTMEIIMTDLDPDIMKIFTQEGSCSAREATEKSGIDNILPNITIDDFLFEPCGYSMNGILRNGSYVTIHITPEPHCSYVSFESNVPHSSYNEVILNVLHCFKPGKFTLTIFANKNSVAFSTHKEIDAAVMFDEWNRLDIQCCKFRSYDLTYAHYAKFPS